MTTGTSTRTQRVEVITRGKRRRRWSIEEKREIAAECSATIRMVADDNQDGYLRHRLNA